MDKKEIQRQRMMRYFIDAAKEIIKEEGIKGVTARSVGDRAGYSYATIYNYFNDLNTLLSYCVFDFLEDCYRYMLNFKDGKIDAKEQIIIYAEAYFKYFAQHPDMFKLIFVEDLGKPPKELIESGMKPSVGVLLGENITSCAKQGYILEKDVELLQGLIGSSIHGKLLFFTQGRSVERLEVVIASLRKEIEFLMKGKEVEK